MAERKVLPEKYRQAANLKEGMEVRDMDGNWSAITGILRVYKPLNIVRITYEDGLMNAFAPKDGVMSR